MQIPFVPLPIALLILPVDLVLTRLVKLVIVVPLLVATDRCYFKGVAVPDLTVRGFNSFTCGGDVLFGAFSTDPHTETAVKMCGGFFFTVDAVGVERVF